jgi:hypothetical protein
MTAVIGTSSRLALAPWLLFAAACGNDESPPLPDAHTPVSYTVTMDDQQVTAPYTFTEGVTVRVRLRFLNAASDDLDDVEGTHFAGLTFQPAALASVSRVAGHNFQFDVTGGTEGSGTMLVGFGHDQAADETTFPAANVTVSP